MSSLFTKIINGDIPSHRIYEDHATFAFLDINPRQAGHTLVVPKVEVDYLFDLSDDDYRALWETVRVVSAAIKRATGCERVVLLVVGYEVPHAHVHLIPTDDLGDVPFPPVDAAAQAILGETAQSIRALLE
jgi:histidine triad (HIT) family protein